MDEKIEVSVVMPIYNEEKYINHCIESLLQQDFHANKMEWIFVDGGSTDNTLTILEKYKKKYPNLIIVLPNPNKTVPFAMNIGIKQAKGEFIIRLDAHAEYTSDYISKCIYYLTTKEIDNVGGILETIGNTKLGKIISKMLSSKFGVGNSNFRVATKSSYVDTVPFGAFRKKVFEKYGLYDERLTRNQDNELNYRIRKNGGKIYLANDIHLSYYCRDSIKGIANMALKNGKWNIITMYLCPGSMGIRHFIPLCFVISIILLSLLGIIVFKNMLMLLMIELIVYFLLDLFFSIKSSKKISELLILLFLFPIFHICYGIGSIIGLFNIGKFKGDN